MAKYANKTCYECGVVKPQPDMRRVTTMVDSGQSNTGFSKRNLAAVIFTDDKRAKKKHDSYFLSPNKRVYKRKRTVWMCKSCAGKAGGSSIAGLFWLIIIGLVLWKVFA